jgi:hypothetical protein
VQAKRASSKKISLTKSAIEATRPPEAGRSYVRDSKTPGLVLCTTAVGSKSFYWYRRTDKGPERVKLGDWPELTVEQARTAADKKNGIKADGLSRQQQTVKKGAFPPWRTLTPILLQPPPGRNPNAPRPLKPSKTMGCFGMLTLRNFGGTGGCLLSRSRK